MYFASLARRLHKLILTHVLQRGIISMGDKMKFNELIQSKGFTIKSLAAAAGVSDRSLEQYSSGRYPIKNARLWFAVKVAKALDTTAEYLLELDD